MKFPAVKHPGFSRNELEFPWNAFCLEIWIHRTAFSAVETAESVKKNIPCRERLWKYQSLQLRARQGVEVTSGPPDVTETLQPMLLS